ncbi:hypothetical protein BZB76_4910 [Actinomadura pelletieri DSM 43383]|uniref:Uncharacterized protein n=1 Tax=Actinomadura pelletieri DSM 43383 TaxID=1120940 RepID=A0A495QIU2_9ACTN|nr:hypothetical protein [Actinomadura pelletieri]RKS72095.1 hypothetical protein BZB76_4910 [Actinomadura pelletieri DSM 43383]
MTYLSALLGLLAIAMMTTLVLLAVRRDRDMRRNAPALVVAGRAQAAGMGSSTEGGSTQPPTVR